MRFLRRRRTLHERLEELVGTMLRDRARIHGKACPEDAPARVAEGMMGEDLPRRVADEVHSWPRADSGKGGKAA